MRKIVIFLIVSAIIASCFCSCQSSNDKETSKNELDDLSELINKLDSYVNEMENWVEKTVYYSYSISVEFENLNDKENFEKRLSAFGFTVSDSKISNNTIEYDLLSHQKYKNDVLLVLGGNYNAYFTDKSGNPVMIKGEQVKSINVGTVASYIRINVTEEYYSSYTRSVIMNVDDSQYNMRALKEDNYLVISIRDDYGTDVHKLVVAYASDPMQGDVKITVTGSAIRIS